MSLPPAVDALIESVYGANPNTVVVNRTGMPVAMPWAPKVPAIIQAWYGGNESGNAIADVVFGDFNPCGKLPISWPHNLSDNPAYLYFGSKTRVLFGDDIYAGYRWYDKLGRPPLWSFGHGLSYTTFALSITTISSKAAHNGRHQVSVSIRLENTGLMYGAEVIQLWVSADHSSIQRPSRELHGFHKVFLSPGEVREVDVCLDEYAMAVWDERENEWYVESGDYRVTAVSSAGGRDSLSRDEATLSIEKSSRWKGL
jgi:beta-glucosidase